MNQFRKKGYAPYLDVFPPFQNKRYHTCSQPNHQTNSLSVSLSFSSNLPRPRQKH